ncbi:hypothetical protein SKAU_G00038290 [Synaphobranchus kaupii]|uniref:HECT domain-containing protein n=1 Tax=Synaphobranchus kaupii TaxID=118154 RepID=A0A9Q1JDW2_SYNKA|nr:hypothetical protein SKAU_G00038290 [Synaphobranchus kaupii]
MIFWGETPFRELDLDQDDALGTAKHHPRSTAQKARITAVSVGKCMIAVVRENGKGEFCLQDEMCERRNRRKTENLSLKEEKIYSLSCGADYIVMVSEKGNVFQLNCQKKPYIPRLLNVNGTHVIQVACGDHHTIALSRDGQLFTWGRNLHGQLGQGEGAPGYPDPEPLLTRGIPLAMIAAGGEHSFALSLSGAVFAWGKNSAGQLGLGDKKDRHSLTLVKSLDMKRTVYISCGDEHTAVLTKGGLVFTFGSGEYGQLGHNSNRDEQWPRLVAELWGSRVTQIACGSDDNHYQTTIVNSGLDLSLARLAFEKLAKKEKVLEQVGSVVQKKLIPSLCPNPAGVEGMRVYLILPELLRVLPMDRELCVKFSEAVCKLHPLNLKILESFFKSLVTVVHATSTWFLHQMCTEQRNFWISVEKTVAVLQKLYEVNYTASRKIEDHNFYINEMKIFIQSVKFEDEDGIDYGGVSQEFFTIFAREIHSMEPRMLELHEDSRLVWFMPEGRCEQDVYYFLGILFGMALYSKCVVNFHFPLALFKKLLGLMLTLEDLKELSPIETRNLQGVLDEDEDVLELLYLDFTAKGHEIVPNGREIPVTKSNRQKYVKAYVDFIFNKSVEKQFAGFLEGFSQGCPNKIWRMFLPEELMALLSGNVVYVWEELQKNAKYYAYEPTDENIQNFWTVFTELSEEKKKNFLWIPLAMIAAGGEHSFALSLSGAVFAWGKNSAGQLGLGDKKGITHLHMFHPLKQSTHLDVENKGSWEEDWTAVRMSPFLSNCLQVGSVVQEKLIPSLCPKPAGVEGMRVYLILPELLRVLPMDRELCVKFSEAVCKLHPLNLKILEGLWSKLPEYFFKSLVKVVHSTSTWFLHQMRTEQRDFSISVGKTVAVLQKLYEVNYTAGRKIEDRNFYINEMKLFIQSEGMQLNKNVGRFEDFMFKTLICYRSIFDMETKCMVFTLNNCAVVFTAQMAPSLQNHLHVNRTSLLTDTFQGLRSKTRDCRWPLLVQFEDEYRMVPGGVVQEFFTIFAREIHLMQPRMLELHEDSRLVWFMPEGRCDHDAYYLLGIVCGMALYNKCVVNFHFPLTLFKKLLGFMLTLEDLKELSPIVARNLQEVLHEDEDVLELLDLDFTAKGHEIVPNGREIPVTKSNRQKYVETYVDFIFNKSVEKQFTDFLKGFSQGCPNQIWRMFLPEELMALLSGNVVYVWEDLQKNAKYYAYEPTDENIQNFWTVFTELSEEKKKNFLSFMTGSDRLPVGGLAEIKLTIEKPNKPNPDDFYPVALICHCLLCLPNYSSIHILREKFVHAISFYEGFAEQ